MPDLRDLAASEIEFSKDELQIQDESQTVPPLEEQEKSRSTVRLFAVLTGLFLSVFIAALDITTVSTALPIIAGDLNSAAGYTWIGGAYLVAHAAAAPIWSKLSDIWGRKPVLLILVALFFGSSIVCALSRSITMLIVGRALQGMAGGGLFQLVHVTISDLFSMRCDGWDVVVGLVLRPKSQADWNRNRSLYLGFLEGMWVVAGGVGPIVGGALAEKVSWPWIFWINLPVSGLTFLLLLFFLDVHNPRTPLRDGLAAIDWFGSVAFLALTLMLLLGLDFGGVVFSWNSPKVICLLVFGAFASLLFIFSEKKLARYPLMPLELFSRRSQVGSLLVTFFHGFTFIGAEYYFPLYLQAAQGASPLRSGLLILPLMATTALMGVVAGIIIHRTGSYMEVMWAGGALLTLGNGLFIDLSATSSLAKILIYEAVVGLGAGLLFEAPLIAIQAVVAQDNVASASATFGVVRNLATAISVVVGGVIFQNSMEMQAPGLRAAGLPANITQRLSGQEAAANVMLIGTITNAEQQLAVQHAFSASLRNMYILYTCTAACCLLATALISKAELSSEHTETTTGIKKRAHDADAAIVSPIA